MYANLLYGYPAPEEVADLQLLQGRDVRGQAGERRAHLQPPRATSRSCATSSACRRSTARRAPARCSAPATSAAEDRLFFIDALRHAGRAELSTFAGGSNVAMDESVWADTPYNESRPPAPVRRRARGLRPPGPRDPERRQQLRRGHQPVHRRGVRQPAEDARRVRADRQAQLSVLEPVDAGHDVISIGSLVAGIFGKGGGGELASALVLEALQKRFGAKQGERVWEDFRSQNDPEAPTTVHGKRFPYETTPEAPEGRRDAGPRARSSRPNVVSSPRRRTTTPADGGKLPDQNLLAPLLQHTSDSNALLVSGRESKSGHPLAVFGPQVSYFMPQILMEEELHAPKTKHEPAIDARGAAFPGTNLYVAARPRPQLRVERDLGGPGHRRHLRGEALQPRRRQADARPPTPTSTRGSASRSRRSPGTSRGRPTRATRRPPARRRSSAIARSSASSSRGRRSTASRTPTRACATPTTTRSTRRRSGSRTSTSRSRCRRRRSSCDSAANIALTFNWLFINRKHIAYFNSGQNPLRPKNVDANLPTMGKQKFLWKGFNPDKPQFTIHNLRRQLTQGHPHVTDQRYITSWNNKQAPGYSAADGQYAYGPQFRKPGARRPGQGRDPGAEEDDAAEADLGHGGRGHGGRPRAVRPALRLQGDRQPRHGRREGCAGKAPGVGRVRLAPHRPQQGRPLRLRRPPSASSTPGGRSS